MRFGVSANLKRFNEHDPEKPKNQNSNEFADLVIGYSLELGCWDLELLKPQPFRNQNTVKQVETPLHKQRQ